MKSNTYDPKTQVPLEIAWLETLLKLAEQIENYQGTHKEIAVSMLTGYVSSAKTILKYKI